MDDVNLATANTERPGKEQRASRLVDESLRSVRPHTALDDAGTVGTWSTCH